MCDLSVDGGMGDVAHLFLRFSVLENTAKAPDHVQAQTLQSLESLISTDIYVSRILPLAFAVVVHLPELGLL